MAKSTCFLCGKEYDVCKFCANTKKYTPWRIMCDTADHFKIYMIVRSLSDEVITASEAREQLDNAGLKAEDIKEFIPSVQETLAPLYETKEAKVGKKQAAPTKAE